MNHVEQYLANEIARYYPDAHGVLVECNDETETIDAFVIFPRSARIELHMDIGSDDDRYTFVSNYGYVLTVPLPPL